MEIHPLFGAWASHPAISRSPRRSLGRLYHGIRPSSVTCRPRSRAIWLRYQFLCSRHEKSPYPGLANALVHPRVFTILPVGTYHSACEMASVSAAITPGVAGAGNTPDQWPSYAQKRRPRKRPPLVWPPFSTISSLLPFSSLAGAWHHGSWGRAGGSPRVISYMGGDRPLERLTASRLPAHSRNGA